MFLLGIRGTAGKSYIYFVHHFFIFYFFIVLSWLILKLQGPAAEKPVEQTKAIVEFIIKVLHDLDASDEVDRMKDMVSVISEYLLNADL